MSDDLNGKDSLGEAANRYVTFQIVSSIIGGVIFLIFLFAVIIPAFNHTGSSSGFSSQSGQMTPISGPASETVTVDGHPATPQEKAIVDQQLSKSSSQPAPQSAPASSR